MGNLTEADIQRRKAHLLLALTQAGLPVCDTGVDGKRYAEGKPSWWLCVGHRTDVLITLGPHGLYELRERKTSPAAEHGLEIEQSLSVVRCFVHAERVAAAMLRLENGLLHARLPQPHFELN